jgi:hypothetical protein
LPALQIAPIGTTSPTLAETMRTCLLRAALSRAAGQEAYVLGNPKAWLGTAYHKVLERLLSIRVKQGEVEVQAERIWQDAIALQHTRMLAHSLNSRFGTPESWAGYYLIHAQMLVQARLLAVPDEGGHPVGETGESGAVLERRLEAFDGKLVGSPDVVRRPEVIDYKSGVILDFDEHAQKMVLKAAYERQLLIYGFLVHENFGWWPKRGLVLPAEGESAEVSLEPDACKREADAAITLLDAFNAKALSAGSAKSLASASPSACKWCSYKLICESFWSEISPLWASELPGACIEGVLEEPPQPIHTGEAVSLTMTILRGTQAPGQGRVSPFNLNLHALPSLTKGDRVRVSGLRVRPDGILVPTLRTIIIKEGDLPQLVMPVANGDAG